MFKYKADYFFHTITRVEIERETLDFVWINGSRRGKRTKYDIYLDSWGKAKAILLKRAKAKIQVTQDKLKQAQGYMSEVEKLEKPDPF